MSIIKNIGFFLILFCSVFILIYSAGHIDVWSYDKDLEQRIPFIKKELIIYGKYDKNIVMFETNYGTKFNYTFPENTPLENIAKFTKENVGQTVDIKIENIQSAYSNMFNIKVQ